MRRSSRSGETLNVFRLEIGEKIDYGYVINRQLNRIAMFRTYLYKRLKSDVVDPDSTIDQVVWNRIADYLTALSALNALLLPELKDREAAEMIAAAHYLAKFRGEDEDVCNSTMWRQEERCREFEEVVNKFKKRFGLRGERVRAMVLELADSALERILVKLNEAGLLFRGRSIKIGSVKVEGVGAGEEVDTDKYNP